MEPCDEARRTETGIAVGSCNGTTFPGFSRHEADTGVTPQNEVEPACLPFRLGTSFRATAPSPALTFDRVIGMCYGLVLTTTVDRAPWISCEPWRG